MICFFQGSDGSQVAYLNDGENEIFAEYEVAEAELEDGTPYMLVQVGDAVLGYISDGEDFYIVDEEGNLAAAAELTEEEADALLSAVDASAADEEAAADEAADADFTYDSGFYVNDGSSDAIICFFEGADGSQVAYVNDGENEVFAEYDVAEAELEDGTPYMLVQVGDAVLGYLTDGDDWYIVDEDGNLAAAAELSEEEAEAILEAVAE